MSITTSRPSADEAGNPASRRRRAPYARILSPLAVIAVMGMVTLAALAPTKAWSSADDPRTQWSGEVGQAAGQELDVVQAATAVAPTERHGFAAEAPPAPAWASAPAVGVPDPGTAQAIGYEMVKARGWDDNEWSCLSALWTRESNWNVYSHNTSSGAYGIPQALPGEKMASAGADWATNPATQISWGLSYITSRYGTPCGAWQHSEERGWY
ncbi:MAG TPA: lytic transglycosylase domain-containing protein [Microbacteriaceae bacterium]|nr:lytic transglycosylase domain-containing protein [Microbacteriaceae bacterium]